MMLKPAPTIAELKRREQQKKEIRRLCRQHTERRGGMTIPEAVRFFTQELRSSDQRRRTEARNTLAFLRAGNPAEIRTAALDGAGQLLRYTRRAEQ